jgi:hypothetical protein
MDRQDVAEALAKPISRELLGSSIPARLAYVGVDGAPRVIPIGFWWTGDHVVMAGWRGHQGRVAVTKWVGPGTAPPDSPAEVAAPRFGQAEGP